MNKKSVKSSSSHTIDLKQLLEEEEKYIKERRKKRGKSDDLENDSLAISLSGGGIRSSTLCLGVLKILNDKKILSNTDYLSSVSGGGYTASYIHTALNGSTPIKYKDLFNDKNIGHLRSKREYLYLFKGGSWKRIFSKVYLSLVGFVSILLNSFWLLLPILYMSINPFGQGFSLNLVIAFSLLVLSGFIISPNFSSLHRFYKRQLKETYLYKYPKIKLLDLNNENSPYPLINATVNVNYDNYHKNNGISYRGQIKSNYFLYSPCYCGSQVTGYVKTDSINYKKLSLATAMATSGAAVNTFMGNQNSSFLVRSILTILNLRLGILAPNPMLSKWVPSFWPYYACLELLGKADTTTNRIQISDGGHVENLAIYELLRRKVKLIIAIDAGADPGFRFSDLRNLVVRAKNELGIKLNFHVKANPEKVIRPSATNGLSEKQYVIAKITSLPGSYVDNYNGFLIYIKSSALDSNIFELRKLKNDVKNASTKENKCLLDSTMYQTYNPDFPHESTTNQFFDEAQWDAYYQLGQVIGEKLCSELGIDVNDTTEELFEKVKGYYESYND